MRVAIVTWGARGDYQPYLALAAAFMRAGHEVQLGAPQLPGFAEAAVEQRVPFVALGDVSKDQPLNVALASLMGVLLDEPALTRMYRQCLELSRWADVMVCHFFQPAGRMAAEALVRPFVTAALVPWQLPSAFYPATLKLPRLGKWFNQLTWKLIGAVFNAHCGGVNRVRHRLGLPVLRDLAGDGFYSPDLNLVAASPLLTPAPPDWQRRHCLTGYWFVDQPEWQPSPEVKEFVERDPKPVSIGFGSMNTPDAERVTRLLVDAVKMSGVRAVIEPGWAGLGDSELPPTMLRVRGVPHYWLFPRVAAVVHHGGAGTTAATLRAGVPSVVVPQAFDQEYWAATAEQHGIAPAPIPYPKLTVERMANALTAVTTDSRFREQAVQIGQRLIAENGTATAVRLVESYVERVAARACG